LAEYPALKKLCMCGCGKEVIKKANKFLHGHNGKLNKDWIKIGHNSNIGRSCSEDKKKHISESLLGHPVPLEQREKQSSTRKRLIKEGKLITYFNKERLKDPRNHPLYLGGLVNDLYSDEFNGELKEEIRKRDNYTCQNCEMTEEEHLIMYGSNLCCHHIDYNKMNSNKENIISLCYQCHGRTNYNRKYWESLLSSKIGVINE